MLIFSEQYRLWNQKGRGLSKRNKGESRSGDEPLRIQTSHGKVKGTSSRRRKRAPVRLAVRPSPRESLDTRELTGTRRVRAREPALSNEMEPEWSVASDSARETATSIAVAALDKKAERLQILDVAGKIDYADFLVIMTGRSDRHAQALAQGIEDALEAMGKRPVAVEGMPQASWVLMDFGEVVVHIFQDDARNLYDIEGLWLDARRLPLPSPR
jgi:ribosome-associated protein